jgi:hypothetical protein
LLVRAAFLRGGQGAIAEGKVQVFDTEQTGQILERAELAVCQFAEGRRAVVHRIRIAVEVRDHAALDEPKK